MVDLSVVDVGEKWVCPDDRQLALRGRLETGWSTYPDNITKRQRSLEVSNDEQKRIRLVLDKADSMRILEEERIGAMVEKLENMKKNVIGDGITTCIVCGTKTGLMKEALKRCSFCSRVACPKCSVAYPLNSASMEKQVHQCVICYEERELWKRSGAWFLKSLPSYIVPDSKNKTGAELRDTLGPSPSLLRGSWHVDAAEEDSEDTSDESDVQEAASSTHAFTISSDQASLRSFQHWTHGIDVETTSIMADDETRSNYLTLPNKKYHHNSSDDDGSSRLSDSDTIDGDPQGSPLVHSSGVITERKMSKGRFKNFRKRSKDSHSKESNSSKSESMEVLHANGGVENSSDHSGGSSDLAKTPNTAKREFYGPLGVIEFTMQYDEATMELLIIVSCGKELKAMDHGKSSDPYVKTHLLPGANKSTKKRTQTVKKTLNPVWNETLVYHGINTKDVETKSVRLSVMDENKMTSNEVIGETVVNLRSLLTRPVQHFRRLLDPQTVAPSLEDLSITSQDEDITGRIEIALHYLSKKQKLVVCIIRCEGLKAMDSNGYSDPYVKCYLKPDPLKKTKRKTSVKKKTLNPEFNQEFTYDTPHHELAKKSLEISVWDHDIGRTNDFIGGVTLGIGSGGEALKHWFETLKTSDRRVIRWHTLSPHINNGADGD